MNTRLPDDFPVSQRTKGVAPGARETLMAQDKQEQPGPETHVKGTASLKEVAAAAEEWGCRIWNQIL